MGRAQSPAICFRLSRLLLLLLLLLFVSLVNDDLKLLIGAWFEGLWLLDHVVSGGGGRTARAKTHTLSLSFC